MLQEYIFITLDIFQILMQNRTIQNDLESWLMFLSTDDPQCIMDLIQAYPYFQELYNDIYTICCNTERVMEMFSEELKILDDNTVQYMIDVMQEKIDSQAKQISDDEQTISALTKQHSEDKETISEKDQQLDKLLKEMAAIKQFLNDSGITMPSE